MTQATFSLDTMHSAASYEQLHADFRWQVPARFNIAWDCCGRHARGRERFGLYFEDESGATAAFSYWDLQQRANRLANALEGLGIQAGDRVAMLLPQRPETVIAYLAIFQMGAIAVPLSHLFGPDALAYRLRDAGAKAAIVDPDTLPKLWSARAELGDLQHVIGVAGARESGVQAWEDLLERASSRYTIGRHGRRRPGAHHLHQRHHRRAERGSDPASRPAREPARIRLLA